MECIIQYMDDLEDLVFACPLLLERLRRTFRIVAVTIASVALQLSLLALALAQPPLAIAGASLLSVGLLYRAAVHHSTRALVQESAR